MSNVLVRNRGDTFHIGVEARNLRNDLASYILMDFEKDGVLFTVGADFCKLEREEILTDAKMICSCIHMANAYYVTTLEEYEKRRLCQDNAIGYCSRLTEELNFIAEMYHGKINVNKYMRIANQISVLSNRIKSWRKSETKIKKKFQ